VDCAVLGANRGLAGDGVLARVTFRAVASGDPQVKLATVDARDVQNEKVVLAGTQPVVPATTTFAAAQPNPFTRTTALSFALAQAGHVELAIYSVDGRKVATLVDEAREAGSYRLARDGRDAGGGAVKAGMYYARLSTPAGRFTRTLVLVK
jgi:hypothetical protein